jgi:hypothetical protein
MNHLNPYNIFIFNLIVCMLLFIVIIYPNFYFGLTKIQYIIFYTILVIIGGIEIFIAIRNLKNINYFYPILVLIIYWVFLFYINIL